MMLNKMLFFTLFIFAIMYAISTNSLINCWMSMEVNLICFIYIIHMNNNIMKSEISMKYFLINSISSMNFLFLYLYYNINWNTWENLISIKLFYFIMNMILLMKLGMAPFHFWFPSISEGLSWLNMLILSTLQKIIPMMIIFFNVSFLMMLFSLLLSSFVGSWGGLNQTSLRKILAYSSINHMSWMTINLIYNFQIWKLYFILYSFHNLIIMYLLHYLNFNNIYNYFFMKNNNYLKIIFFLNFLSLGGLPPFLGFMMKWITIKMILFKMNMLIFILIMNSLISLYYYVQITYSSMFLNSYFIMNNLFYLKNKSSMINIIITSTISLNLIFIIFY
uniref:NADH-ubiquinone oxidoreductase chain 2 n=1 Tax=Orthotrichia sp. XG-2021 TaxID=2996738 RepID=A0A9E8LP46_9NEOP|nr:NADH dehydrogenase subunit 2 [Orthotrichia sp. XG-2021]